MHFSGVLLNTELGLFASNCVSFSALCFSESACFLANCSLAFTASALALALTDESEDWQDVLETELLPSSSIRFSLDFDLLSTDDTDLYYRGASLAHLNETINKDLERLDNWLKGNKLSLNVVNMVSMNILSRQKHQKVLGELDLKLRDTTIQNVEETEYLVLQIDRHLTWKKHMQGRIQGEI